MSAPLDNLTTEAAVEYRAGLPKRPPRAKPTPLDDLGRQMVRMHIIEALGDVPRDALACVVALDFGDDREAYYRMSRIVAAVREAARSTDSLADGGGE